MLTQFNVALFLPPGKMNYSQTPEHRKSWIRNTQNRQQKHIGTF